MNFITSYLYMLSPYLQDKDYEKKINVTKKVPDYSFAGDVEQFLSTKTEGLAAKWDKDNGSTLIFARVPSDCFLKDMTLKAVEKTDSLKANLNIYARIENTELVTIPLKSGFFLQMGTVKPTMNLEFTGSQNWTKWFDFDGGPDNILKRFALDYIKTLEAGDDFALLDLVKKHYNDRNYYLGFEVTTASTDGTGNDNLIAEISFVKSSISTNTVV